MQTIVALFDTSAHAEAALGDLEIAGFSRSEISVVSGERPHGTETTSPSTGMGAALVVCHACSE